MKAIELGRVEMFGIGRIIIPIESPGSMPPGDGIGGRVCIGYPITLARHYKSGCPYPLPPRIGSRPSKDHFHRKLFDKSPMKKAVIR